MAAVKLTTVHVQNPVAKFTDPINIEIEFECIEAISQELDWKLVYVGSTESKEHDQVLDSVVVGPVAVGKSKFVFTAASPDANKIPKDDLIGAAGLLLTCSYNNQDFVQVGYFVNNEYVEEALKETPPATPVLEKIQRSILFDKPRLTQWNIDWGTETSKAQKQKELEEVAKIPEPPENEIIDDTNEAVEQEEDEEDNVDMEDK